MRRLPEWLKVSRSRGENYFRLKSLTRQHGLHTVCESASCPNIGSCWDSGTLTLMILGDTCTRACRFCDVPTGHMHPPRQEEPAEVAKMLFALDLIYAVITSVDRDDLPDGGAGIWAETVLQVKQRCLQMKVEALVPDFRGERSLVEKVCRSSPDVLAHNIETVASLQPFVRPQCRYSWSLDTLKFASRMGLVTKSSLMLGFGEKREEVISTMHHLVESGCHILSLGQYLRPSTRHHEVVEYIHPDTFAEYKAIGESLGLAHVEAGPLVRSSFYADRQASKLLGFYR